MNKPSQELKRERVIGRILETKIIAIIRGIPETKIVDLVSALSRGGIDLIEITFNLSDPSFDQAIARQIQEIRRLMGDQVLMGAGTVLEPSQVDIACEAGASFILSPNTDDEVIRYTKKRGLVSIPGAFTASEIVTAQKAGADFIKIFPAGTFGTDYIQALGAPLSASRFLAVGGISETNMADFLKVGCVGVGVGGNLVNGNLVANDRYDEIEAAAKRLVTISRNGGNNG